MPHVVLQGQIDAKKAFEELEPVFVKFDDGIVKTSITYISESNDSLLVESLAIQKKEKQSFFTIINNRDDGIVIRIHPLTDIEKTSRVKQVLVNIAKQLLMKFEATRIGPTNLQEYFD